MKNIYLSISIVIFLFTLLSCQNKSTEKTTSGTGMEEPSDTPGYEGYAVRLPLDSAIDYIKRYGEVCRSKFDGQVPIKAFTIHSVDLFEAMGMPAGMRDSTVCKYKRVRAYLGINSHGTFKLMIVPVQELTGVTPADSAGRDTILQDDNGRYVLDLNAPCPATCDFASELYNASN
ncbi:MAG: hypothetical protein V4538_17130 [Bacteroidota bacterium]